jgi:hypothetical protein
VQNTVRIGGQAFFRLGIGCRSSLIRRLLLPFLASVQMICGMTPALLLRIFAQVRVDGVEFGGVVATALGTKAAVFLHERRTVS